MSVKSQIHDWAKAIHQDEVAMAVIRELAADMSERRKDDKVELTKLSLMVHSLRQHKLLERVDGLFRLLVYMQCAEDKVNDPEDDSYRALLRDIGLCLKDVPRKTLDLFAMERDPRVHSKKDFWQKVPTIEQSSARIELVLKEDIAPTP